MQVAKVPSAADKEGVKGVTVNTTSVDGKGGKIEAMCAEKEGEPRREAVPSSVSTHDEDGSKCRIRHISIQVLIFCFLECV